MMLKKQNGYSLVEMLVTISIIVLIVGAFTAGGLSRRSKVNLNASAQRLLQDLRTIQNKSLAPYEESPTIVFLEGFTDYYIFSGGVCNTIGLEKGIIINKGLTVSFKPPHPDVYINGEKLQEGESETIQLAVKDGPLCDDGDPIEEKTIKIHSSGLIEIVR